MFLHIIICPKIMFPVTYIIPARWRVALSIHSRGFVIFQGCINCSDVTVLLTYFAICYNNVQVFRSIGIPILHSYVLKTCFKTAAVKKTWRGVASSTVICFQLDIKGLGNTFYHKSEVQVIQKSEMLQHSKRSWRTSIKSTSGIIHFSGVTETRTICVPGLWWTSGQ